MEEPGRFHDATLVRIRHPDRTGGVAFPVAHEKGRDLRLWCEFFGLVFPSRVRDVCGPRGSSEYTRRAGVLDGVRRLRCWAKDIQELFRLERRDSFQRFTELVIAQSGGIFDATRFARPCEVSRPTITNYLRVLEATFVAHVVRPFSSRRPTEIIAAPKVYGFDTGFICYYRGWQDLRMMTLGRYGSISY